MGILKVNNLSVSDKRTGKVLVDDISFILEKNSCLGIIGESGSGKSMTCKAVLGLTPASLETRGTIFLDGKNLLTLSQKEMREIRGKRISIIIQDAMGAFDPLYTLGYQFEETLQENMGWDSDESYEVSIKFLKKMGIRNPESLLKKYPHELSGGMLQRCMIAITLALEPEIIIADEPTTALDSINQYEIIEEFRKLKDLKNSSLIFISHDLGVVQKVADKIMVMKEGRCVEQGDADEVLHNGKHEYTRYLTSTRLKLTKNFSESMEGEKYVSKNK